ncbi:hypothetical protein HII17_03500 [Thalassotalea sp. M1531]|uniref:Uncharacterized protein n=1 Tax=Thalassotalea algicola TaxID=2716224 RepID=A0A7Y0Q5R8_9GAMM|nr:hypothetical protein [Thalassotalea algicola]NMP30618.1 hypothetical protein [Thalassotalea algicola]
MDRVETTEKHLLQKIAKIVGYICTLIAVILGIYLATIYGTDDVVHKSAIGATTFFFFMVGLVLNVLANTNLPNLKVK